MNAIFGCAGTMNILAYTHQQTYKLRIYFNCKLFLNDPQVLVQLSYWIENVFMFPYIIARTIKCRQVWTMNGRTAIPIYCTVWTNDGVAVLCGSLELVASVYLHYSRYWCMFSTPCSIYLYARRYVYTDSDGCLALIEQN